MTKIAVFNQKGGVGKTTTALNLAAAISLKGGSPLVIDLDPQCHLTEVCPQDFNGVGKSLFSFYQDNKSLRELMMDWGGVGKFIPSHRQLVKVDSIYGKGPGVLNRLRLGIEALNNDEDITDVVMDCYPYFGVLSLSAIFAADLVIIPIASDFLSLQAAIKIDKTLLALEPVLKNRVNRRYLMTRYDRRRTMTFTVQNQAIKSLGDEVCKTVISENVTTAESVHHKKDIFSFAPNSTSAHDYKALLKELIEDGLVSPIANAS